VRRFFLLAVALAAVAACGGGDGEEPTPEARFVSSAQVIDHFAKQPGKPTLRKEAGADPAWEQLGLGLDATPEELRRYGTFSIYVVQPGRREAVASLLRSKETRKPLTRGPRGIYWEYDTLSRSYVAHTRYGANVVLAWWNEQREPGTDVRWERLNEMLAALERG
jgi:hypothetical protein